MTMVTRSDDAREDGPFFLVFNAARKEVDCAHIARHLGVRLEEKPDLSMFTRFTEEIAATSSLRGIPEFAIAIETGCALVVRWN